MQSLSDLFARFAELHFKETSPLYERLSLQIAGDPELLELADHTREGQLQPNMLFGAVHYLLLRDTGHPLRYFYPSLHGNPGDPALAAAPFKDFCLAFRDEIIQLLASKRVQTNEVNRCAFLYPAFCSIYRQTGKPLALIEIGTSAGLQLLWDQYSYSYGTGDVYGSASAELHLESEPRGGKEPFLLPHSPPVSARIGIDLHVNDLNQAEDLLWLKALIWPEHRKRRLNLEKAAACLKKHPVELIEGDAIGLISSVAAALPDDASLCIFHTHVANQFSAEAKLEWNERLQALGKKRDFYHLYNNMTDMDLHLDAYRGGQLHPLTIAATEGHGRWFRWLV